MSIEYTIKGGDNLTKIAREQYGLSGKEAYNKALEIAKQNGIENPNLIYAGAKLQLFDTPDEQKEQGGAEKAEEQSFENTYQELLNKQKALYQALATEADPEGDWRVTFADEETFADDATKLELYKEAVLALALEDIEANDKEDEDGQKDGQLSLEEFKEAQLAFFEATYSTSVKDNAKQAFILNYQIQNGKDPSTQEINDAVDKAWQESYDSYSADLTGIFETYDLDGNNFLNNTELATTYIAMDASKVTGKEHVLKAVMENPEDSIEFDGVIDLQNISQVEKEGLTGLHNMFFGKLSAA